LTREPGRSKEFIDQATVKQPLLLQRLSLFPPSNPSPEGLAEGFGESLLEKKHIVSAEIHHAPWVTKSGIVVVPLRLTGVSHLPLGGVRPNPAVDTGRKLLSQSLTGSARASRLPAVNIREVTA
jgi:hypothetical protein